MDKRCFRQLCMPSLNCSWMLSSSWGMSSAVKTSNKPADTVDSKRLFQNVFAGMSGCKHTAWIFCHLPQSKCMEEGNFTSGESVKIEQMPMKPVIIVGQIFLPQVLAHSAFKGTRKPYLWNLNCYVSYC